MQIAHPHIQKGNPFDFYIVLEYCKPIYPKDLSREERKKLSDIVENVIKETYYKNQACMEAADSYCKEKGYRSFIADQMLFNYGVKYMNPMADDTLGVMPFRFSRTI